MGALRATLILGGLLLTVGAGRAVADSECMQDAKARRGECRAACEEDFTIARDLCRNIDPECAAGCRADLESCRAPIVSALEQCVDACRVRLNAERAACPRKGRARDFCVDRAQIRAFLCRDECREDLQVRAGLKACRERFRTCMDGCGIPTEPSPAATATPVKTEAPKATEVPQPTVVPTEPPPPPTATRTATPKPEPTLTPIGPR
ncbi:MAG: hypothetical protein IT293_08340 [Deltaproteobacteria bacterium]|nr:hypothetical protein [Deltaproteobacteria bacterium]